VTLSFLTLGALRADDSPKPPGEIKPALRLAKGARLDFVVERRDETSRGEGTQTTSTHTEYSVTVVEAKDGGELVLEVKYESLKSKRDGGQRSWDFDSAKKDHDGEVEKIFAQAVSAPYKVTVSGGSVREVSGPSEESSGDGSDQQRRFRDFLVRQLAGREGLRRDLGLILASPVQGKSIEKGKEYRAELFERPREPAADGGERRRRGFNLSPLLVYKLDGEAEVAGTRAAKFVLSSAPRESEDLPAGAERKETTTGTAALSLKDGVLLECEVKTDSQFKGEFNGQEFNISRKTEIKVSRKGAGKPAGTTL
jgi:hypothetical protein